MKPAMNFVRLVWVATLFLSFTAQAEFRASPNTDHAIERMNQIEAHLPREDGIARFNFVYRATTKHIKGAIDQGRFSDGPAMERFTTLFANYYFRALDSYLEQDHAAIPLSWRQLFKTHTRTQNFSAVQFVIAGMDAHIGRDLPVVLSELYSQDSHFPSKQSEVFSDFILINTILRETFADIHDHILTNCDDKLGSLFCKIADDTAIPTIASMRRKAWTDGYILWRSRGFNPAHDAYLEGVDLSIAALIKSVLLLKF